VATWSIIEDGRLRRRKRWKRKRRVIGDGEGDDVYDTFLGNP